MNLRNESKTLFIPLFGKALMSKKGVFLHDKKAQDIIDKIDYDFKGLKQSKWLSMYMSLRALIIDNLCNEYIDNHSNTTVIHLGCGLDSRCLRVRQDYKVWYDIDYDNVINIRKQFYDIDSKHQMIGSSVLDYEWMNYIDANDNIFIVAEGLMMYLSEEEIKDLLLKISQKFKNIHLLFDSYSKRGFKLSRIKNPVKKMDAKIKYGFDNPDEFLLLNENLKYIRTHLIKKYENNLNGITKFIFNKLYCGKISQSIYKIYEFSLNK